MMIGCVTEVYYVRASWVQRFAKLNPHKKIVFRFLESIREILSPRKFQRKYQGKVFKIRGRIPISATGSKNGVYIVKLC